MYTDLSGWWPLLSSPAEYQEEAAVFGETLRAHACRPLRSLLELGSGGGNNASHLKRHFDMTLVDRAPGMLAVSRALNPECRHIPGDMRTVRLGRAFDAVFIHDAIAYLTTEDELAQAMATAWVHCATGGVALFVPDCTRETFHPSTSHGGHDGDGRGLRYLEWSMDPDPADTTYETHFAYLLRETDATVRCVQDRHVLGLFTRATWLRLIRAAGFAARCISWSHSEAGELLMFVGQKDD